MNKVSEVTLKGKCSVCGEVVEYPYTDRVDVVLFGNWRKYHPKELCEAKKNRKMLAVRMEIAVSICNQFPKLYSNIKKGKLPPDGSAEECAADVLGTIIFLEPTIGKVLELYYK